MLEVWINYGFMGGPKPPGTHLDPRHHVTFEVSFSYDRR